MTADQVRTIVAAEHLGTLNSPLAQLIYSASAMAQLESSDADRVILLADAREHANACLRACGGWTVETLGHNIESAFGSGLDADECDEIARRVLANKSA